MTEYKIFPPYLAIDSMRDSGYKDAAHAVAELIDNSIQAGEKSEYPISVEVICVEKENFVNNRQSSKIEEIAVYDNASGMTPDVLSMALAFGQGTRRGLGRGMGKFGMGLPNASISQCDRVDVWSWRNGEIYRTYLDIDEIQKQQYDTVPGLIKEKHLPSEWVEKIKSEINDSGTLIVWSRLDRLKWKRHKAFFSNTEFIVGRMYRYFIAGGKCKIRMAAYGLSNNELLSKYVRPNDPLYLMENTQAPAVIFAEEKYNFDKEAAFDLVFDSDESEDKGIKVAWKGKSHKIGIKVSQARQDFRRTLAQQGRKAGDTELGKHCAKNQGVSVVRAGRELEINRAFEIAYDPVERWWGIEVSFEPELDEIFGVTNNKQSATAFRNLKLAELAEEEGQKPGEMRATLESDDDPRFIIIHISEIINSKLGLIRKNLEKQTKGVLVQKAAEKGTDKAQTAATKSTQKDGEKGTSDILDETLSPEEKIKEIDSELEKDGVSVDEEGKKTIHQAWLGDSKYIFNTAEIRGSRIIFDVSQPAGKIKVTFNSKHPAYEHFIKHLEIEDGLSFDALKLLFAAWARMEDRIGASSQKEREYIEDMRILWGQIAKEMLDEYNQ